LRKSPKKEGEEPPKRRAFGARRQPTLDDTFVACINKGNKSVKRHSKIHGERGYLDFIIQFTQY
jgi:hypothetical protein